MLYLGKGLIKKIPGIYPHIAQDHRTMPKSWALAKRLLKFCSRNVVLHHGSNRRSDSEPGVLTVSRWGSSFGHKDEKERSNGERNGNRN